MTTTAPPKEALQALTLNDNVEDEVNPWASKAPDDADGDRSVKPLNTSNEPPPVQEPAFTPVPTPPRHDSSIINEFDPLVDADTKNAHDAWAAAEGHPPKLSPSKASSPPQTPTKAAQKPLPPDPESPTKAVPSSSSAFTTTFANLARSFSRPRSSGSDYVATTSTGPGSARNSSEQPRPATPLRSQTSATTKSDTGSRPPEAQFDFQRFLDQLKTRSAEPVSQYLRRYTNRITFLADSLMPRIYSFLTHFSKRTFSVPDQVKLVQQFLSVR
jgi:hypothetical protein